MRPVSSLRRVLSRCRRYSHQGVSPVSPPRIYPQLYCNRFRVSKKEGVRLLVTIVTVLMTSPSWSLLSLVGWSLAALSALGGGSAGRREKERVEEHVAAQTD